MAYQKQVWRDFDDTKTELQNINNGAVATPERLNHIENGIANSADKAEVTAQLQQTEQNHQTLKGRFDSNQLVVSKVAPEDTNFWFEDRGKSGLEISTGTGINIANAVVSDDEINDKTKLWFDK